MVTKNLWLTGCVAAALAATTSASFADSADASTPMIPASSYALLGNQTFTGIDLNQAKAEGFSDSEIATMAKIAGKSGMTFSEIKDRVQSGASFGVLADQYNLRLKDVWDNQDYKDKIEQYKMAWAATGRDALKQKVMGSQETYHSSSTWSAPAPTTTPAPNNTTPAPMTTTPATPAPAMPDTNTTAAPGAVTPAP